MMGSGEVLFQAHRQEFDRAAATARGQLDETTWQAAWAEGRAMTLEQAIAYALEESEEAGDDQDRAITR
jgi:hypothetical protein